ncbi:MAG: hypothetical protein NC111_04350 [Bacteroides sp.]|nr:hypothetical protein [Bacteroides sp.]MCM1413035.1 hypothetical protein [Bacteroides sp.]MCM1471741.1 hypothetical protein [Bacteroides sp.]
MNRNYPNCIEHVRTINDRVLSLNIYPPFVDGNTIYSVRGMVIAQDIVAGSRLVKMISDGKLDFYPEWYDPNDLIKPYKGLQNPTEFEKHGGYFISDISPDILTEKSEIRWTETYPPTMSDNDKYQSSNTTDSGVSSDFDSPDLTDFDGTSPIRVNVDLDTLANTTSETDMIRRYIRKPSYPGGKDSLQSYINQNIVPLFGAPQLELEDSIRIILDISKSGCILSAKLEKEYGSYIDSMIISSLVSMPRWNPGGVVTINKKTSERHFEPRQMTTYIDLIFHNIESEKKIEEATPVPLVFPLETNGHKLPMISDMCNDWRVEDVIISPSTERISAPTINECNILITIHLSDKFIIDIYNDSDYSHTKNLLIGCYDGNRIYTLATINIDKETLLQYIEQAKRSDDGHTAMISISSPYKFGKEIKRMDGVLVADNPISFIDLNSKLNTGEINFIQQQSSK